MSVSVKLKHSSVADRVPTSGDLVNGELALNLADEKVYMKNASGNVVQVAGPNSGDGEYVKVAGDNMTGDLTLGTDKITLGAADGSASLAGNVLVETSSDEFVKIEPAGVIKLETNNAGMSAASALQVKFDGSQNASIDYDGSASFVGTVTTEATFLNELQDGYSPTGSAYKVFNGSSTFVDILNNGNASFAGTLDVGDNNGASSGTGLYMQPNGQAYLFTSSAMDALNIYQGTSRNAFINSSGSASFAGGAFTINGSGTIETNLNTSGNIKIDSNGSFDSPKIWLYAISGNATFTGTVTANVVPPSDARFKENITPAKPQLADVVALGGILKNYDWNDEAPLNEEIRSVRQLGLIAQEVQEICPTIAKTISRTKQGKMLTPEKTIPAVYEEKVVPAEYKTIVIPAKLGPKGKEIVPASTEEVLITPEYTEQVLVKEEEIIPATYEELDDSYKGLSQEALIMKLIGAVAELKAEVDTLKLKPRN